MHRRHERKAFKGRWTGVAPLGYCYGHSEGSRKIIPGEKGKLIARAFHMKVEGLTNTEIAARLFKLGLRVDKKRLSELLRNPFYCGYIAHSLLDGQVIKGKHEPLVSEELFLRANDMLKKNAFGYKHNISGALEGNKNGQIKKISDLPGLVAPAGIVNVF